MYFHDILHYSWFDLVGFQLREISGRPELDVFHLIAGEPAAIEVLIFALEGLRVLQMRDGAQDDVGFLLLEKLLVLCLLLQV